MTLVPRLQEVKDLTPCLRMRVEVFAHEQLCFECAEERLAHGIGVRRQLRP
jgi:hypothetical protein